jgi:hypothetical protein
MKAAKGSAVSLTLTVYQNNSKHHSNKTQHVTLAAIITFVSQGTDSSIKNSLTMEPLKHDKSFFFSKSRTSEHITSILSSASGRI